MILIATLTCYSCVGTYRDTDKITLKEKAAIIDKISSILKNDGYAFNQTFNDIDVKLAKHRASIDTTTTIGSFVSSLKPVFKSYGLSHLRIRTPEQVSNRKRGMHVGIGASLVKTDSGYFVTRVVNHGVADLAGIKWGDFLISENNNRITSAAQLKHKPHTITNIQLKRRNKLKSLKVKYFEHPIFSKDSLFWLDDEIAVIAINSFRNDAYDKSAIESMFSEADHAKKIVLDLRSNGGGASGNLRHLLSMVVPYEQVCQYFIYREDHEGFVNEYKRRPNSFKELVDYNERGLKPAFQFWWEKTYQGEIIIIIDENSGSAADIFPVCIQDLNRGTIIGKQSIGQVLFGNVEGLNLGMEFMYPTGEAVRLNKAVNLEGHGCVPDISFSRENTANTAFVYQFIKNKMK